MLLSTFQVHCDRVRSVFICAFACFFSCDSLSLDRPRVLTRVWISAGWDMTTTTHNLCLVLIAQSSTQRHDLHVTAIFLFVPALRKRDGYLGSYGVSDLVTLLL